MRGKRDTQPPMFFAINVEDRIRPDHPLRPLKRMIDEELAALSPLFDAAYAADGRPGVPPERLLKALLLQALYSVRSETQLVERVDTDLLFRWFLDMDPAEPAFDQTAFTRNRPRLERHGVVAAFFDGVVRRAMRAGLCSDDHFSVDGTLIESHASIKSFVPKDGTGTGTGGDANGFKSRNAEVDFHGQKRSNATHASRTDPEARLYKKADGQPAKLYHAGHAVTENRHGLVVAVAVTEASGAAEPAAAEALVDALRDRLGVRVGTLGGDRGYDSGPHLIALEGRGVEPHVAMKAGPVGGTGRRKKADLPLIAARRRMAERARGDRYRVSQRCRKRVEEAFGWLKTVAGLYRTRLVGRWKLAQQVQLAAAAYNLVRMRRLAA
ncbi:MAG TPA: IS5 family transposase [Propionibacteriaceae bacterium]|nr:IS5 family transposase [Propionibacteriaceae bacterium]